MKIDLLSKQELIDVLAEFKTTLIQELTEKFEHGGGSGATRWIRTDEVMKTLGCCESTLRNYRKNGLLTATKIGARLFYNRIEVESLIQAP